MKTRTIMLLLLPLWIAHGVEKLADHRVTREVEAYWNTHTCSSVGEYNRILHGTKTEYQSMYWLSGALFYGGGVRRSDSRAHGTP